MTAINISDLLYVTALSGGVTLLSTSLRGASSVSDVFRHIKNQIEPLKGLIILRIRNSTQGWAQQHTLVLKEPKTPLVRCAPAVGRRDSYPSLFPDSLICDLGC